MHRRRVDHQWLISARDSAARPRGGPSLPVCDIQDNNNNQLSASSREFPTISFKCVVFVVFSALCTRPSKHVRSTFPHRISAVIFQWFFFSLEFKYHFENWNEQRKASVLFFFYAFHRLLDGEIAWNSWPMTFLATTTTTTCICWCYIFSLQHL